MTLPKKRTGKKRLHWGNFKTPAIHCRLTKAERREAHKKRMLERRIAQLARLPGFIAVDHGKRP